MGLLNIIRRLWLRDGLSIREIARRTGLSRNTVKKHLKAGTIEPVFATPERPSKLDPFAEKLAGWLKMEARKSRKQRRTLKQLHADLVTLGFNGSYNRVAAFARQWRMDRQREQQTTGRGTFVPLSFGPGEAFQFDWSEDFAVLGGERTKLQMSHIKLSHSRADLLRGYFLQTQEMLFDAHWQAFRVFGGVPRRGIYDSEAGPPSVRGLAERRRPWIASVEARNAKSTSAFSPWQTTMYSTPSSAIPLPAGASQCGAIGSSPMASGLVEKNVRDSRHQLLQGMPDFPDLEALNVWLEERCMTLWNETAHGTLPGSIADAWAEEQTTLMPLPVAFDGFAELSKRVSPNCLITAERIRDKLAASKKRPLGGQCPTLGL